MSEKGKDVLTFCASCCNRLQQVSFFCPLSPISPSALPHTHTHSPVVQAGRHTSVVPAGPGTGTSAGAVESQPPASSSSPPVPPSPSPPPADGCTPLVSVIYSGRTEGRRSAKGRRTRSEKSEKGGRNRKREEI